MSILMNKWCLSGAVLSRFLLPLLVLLLGRAPLPAQDRGLTWAAALNTDLMYSLPDAAALYGAASWNDFADTLGSGVYLGTNTLSLSFNGGDRDSAQIVGLVKFMLPYGEAAALLNNTPQALPFALECSKLYVTLSFTNSDLSLGRMIVNYGKGRLFSPEDLFSAVNLQDQALGRTGTDVLRLQLPLSDLSGIEMVSSLALPPEKAVFGGRAFASFGGWDLSALVFHNGGGLSLLQSGAAFSGIGGNGPIAQASEPALLAGFDVKGDLVAGLYGEALAAIPYKDYHLEPDRSGFSVVLGTDYSFAGTLFCTVEYQGRFGEGPRIGQFQADTSLFTNLSYKIDDWTSVSSYLIYAVDTGAWQVMAALNRSLMRRTSIVLYGAANRGDVRSLGPSAQNLPVMAALGLTLKAAF
ncbi:hypothetical protein [Gracilinema caldarium]|uniref:hypothetical protein n=1 Tax=Gracilinema caldarium TaxID=215591 RepID=UPI0026F2DE90|nr:hypothetical protein [Gracilinema caldarium]